MTDLRIAALIVAGGTGARFGGSPKQYRPLGGRSVIAHGFDGFAGLPVHLVVGAGQEDALRAALGDRVPASISTGGATRRASVRAGLEAIAAAGGADLVLIHDAARPGLPAAVRARLIAALATAEAAIPVLPVVDTLVRVAAGQAGDTVPREGLGRVQTPQAFHFPAILAAHRAWSGADEPTDDAQVARAAGLAVQIVEGDAALEKITHEADLAAAAARLLVPRVGIGYDVHAFDAGDHVMLCGVRVPHDRALAGHSDADVGLHAITDALLGTIADGDIGSHFPPSDPRWKGAESGQFLSHAAGLVRAAGGVIDHVDCTIICEAPKVGPHRDAMRARVAALLDLPIGRVSIKATTTERLGFTGRQEGMAAQAIASVRLPA
ncbi:bifunctional 2-C-methyl-D-erythritol 4-phosphate cytidylyltransferase/2-C-methyl-D-erythritol 2,4-cyclodiphosphate synthase [Sphingomonas morindae]|uniref:Bifunctional enzyme IspD/IspF n=1 Tax=Sphingomonas morindae TaxID=1541170 RepID=A0ABY4X7S0_9SPHN|nr:bifunctional 2-C-methyl-D-erythritol 4-phosphate cytidylyltransferase/2-C-methyl-D-erythritol 2,4-cyclodiphosphate synthase [Sphingomonas morindae]USI72983.1 bifunctional 2-C-methyl-D-erythritol 4-phosphate cytidylyltransferase/2-C-methyl-D-erythritol 2,4-cyclodiphosphate synthase [Sphingomonas morindae]